jgi:hypothetical protein
LRQEHYTRTELQLAALETHFGDPERLSTGRNEVQFLPKQLRNFAALFGPSVTKNFVSDFKFFSNLGVIYKAKKKY